MICTESLTLILIWSKLFVNRTFQTVLGLHESVIDTIVHPALLIITTHCHLKTREPLENQQSNIAFTIRWRTCHRWFRDADATHCYRRKGKGRERDVEVMYDEGAAGLALARSLYTSRPPLPLTSLPVLPASCHPRISLHPLPPNRTFPPNDIPAGLCSSAAR